MKFNFVIINLSLLILSLLIYLTYLTYFISLTILIAYSITATIFYYKHKILRTVNYQRNRIISAFLITPKALEGRVNTESSLAQIVAIFTARCDDVHAAREWILIEHVTSNEQYLRVFPAGCKVPIKMQILRRHLGPS